MTSSQDPRRAQPPGVSAVVALAIGSVLFVSLAILGLGMLSYFAHVDIIPAQSVFRWAGIVAMVVAVAGFAGMLSRPLRASKPAFSAAPLVGVAVGVLHLLVLGAAVLIGGAGVVDATVAVSDLVTHGGSLVLVLAGAIAAWVAIALRRAPSQHPHWPWENDSESD